MRYQPRGPFLSVNAKQLAQPAFQVGPNRCKSDHGCQYRLNAICPRSSVRSERHRAKVEVAGASPAVDAILPLCLSSHRTSFVNSYSSVRVRPEAPIYGDHDVTAASRPVKAFVPVRIRLVTPISMDRNEVARVTAIMRSWFAHSEPCQDARRQAGRAEAVASACSGLPAGRYQTTQTTHGSFP